MENRSKKKVELKEEHVQYLSELPESGMGYQIIDITFKDGRQLKNRIVVNSQFLLLEDGEDIDPLLIEKVAFKEK
jgi:hypothetical protein